MSATILRHREDSGLRKIVRKGRYTSLKEEGYLVISELDGPVSKWLCGQYAEKFALVSLKRCILLHRL